MSSEKKPYEKVVMARSPSRKTSIDYIDGLFTEFTELHGDRRFSDDTAIIAGLAYLNGEPITIIAQEKGKDLEDKTRRNYGMAHPEGYRKALRLMKQAEKFNRPIICLVDTSGAFCGIGAEQRGQGLAIAENLFEMSALRVPIISVLIGEGGSGGALGIAVADEVWMLENSVYSVISPEGCASIIYKDSKRASDAADNLKLTATDLLGFEVIEKIISENDNIFESLKKELVAKLSELKQKPIEKLLEARYERFRKIK